MPQNRSFGVFDPVNWEQYQRTPRCMESGNTSYDMLIVKITRRQEQSEKGKRGNQNVTSHVFAETTHAVAAADGFAYLVIPMT